MARSCNIQVLKQLAVDRGGLCLTKTFTNLSAHYEWQCRAGHHWKASGDNVFRLKSWCPKCARNSPLSIEDMHKMAIEKGGLCLSKKYIRSSEKLKWKCSFGHVFFMRSNKIRSGGSWCPTCAKASYGSYRKHSIEIYQKLAQSLGGKCLSSEYKNSATLMRWQCSAGHQWIARASSIKGGSWCAACANLLPVTIQMAHETAKDRNGICLSKTLKNINSILSYKCSNGHVWQAPFRNVKEGSCCPICSSGLSERIIRKALEDLTGKKFHKVRPKWLRNPETNIPMELDGFNMQLKVAFEHQGIQHHEEVGFFHKSEHSFKRQRKRDSYKAKLLELHGIQLITVPALHKKIQLNELENYLRRILASLKIKIVRERKLTFGSAYDLNSHEKEILENLALRARNRGGTLAPTKYLGSIHKYDFICGNGHKFKLSPSVLKRGGWCLICGQISTKLKLSSSIDEFIALAKDRGGKLISKHYENQNTQIKWACKEGHTWWATPGKIKHSKRWCPVCRRGTGDRKKL